jgi:hypothetical protein
LIQFGVGNATLRRRRQLTHAQTGGLTKHLLFLLAVGALERRQYDGQLIVVFVDEIDELRGGGQFATSAKDRTLVSKALLAVRAYR